VSNTQKGQRYDAIVVGSGPGGAPVARELARAGKRVLILERGARHERALGFPGGARILEGAGIVCRSREGAYIARGITVGGSSVVYNGNVYFPPERVYAQVGLDFLPELHELAEEIGVRELPPRFFAKARALPRVLGAAEKLGLHFEPQKKFIAPDKCRPGCDSCMMGCPRGAKWTTRNMVDQACKAGAKLLTETRVERVLFEKDRAVGVVTARGEEYRADMVVLAAGGVGTPAILLRSGVSGVGENFYIDPMNIVVGHAGKEYPGAWGEMSFTHAIEDLAQTEGFIIGNVSAQNALLTSFLRANVARHNLGRALQSTRAMGLFVKVADSHEGRVFADGSLSKPKSARDRARMKRGTDLAMEILARAGVPKTAMAVGQSIGGHPGGTVPAGTAADFRLRAGRENLFVCDGSVFPESLGVPPSLSIMGLSLLLGRMLAGKTRHEDRTTAPGGRLAAGRASSTWHRTVSESATDCLKRYPA
jgi:choline dehydrogenase-like flavoprotein